MWLMEERNIVLKGEFFIMNCLIIDKVWGGIAEELSKVMNVKTAANLPCSKEELIAEIGDVIISDLQIFLLRVKLRDYFSVIRHKELFRKRM